MCPQDHPHWHAVMTIRVSQLYEALYGILQLLPTAAPNRTCAAPAEIKTRDDVLQMGIDKYNEECRSIVMR